MESSEPSLLSGPIPLPAIKLPAFITGGSMENKMEEGKPKPKSKGVESGLEGDLEDLFQQFIKLTPGMDDAVVFLKKLPGKLASLGEGVGCGTSLKRGSFLWSAWRYAWSQALGKSFVLLCCLLLISCFTCFHYPSNSSQTEGRHLQHDWNCSDGWFYANKPQLLMISNCWMARRPQLAHICRHC